MPNVPSVINSGDTTWVLVCAALVLFMTPGLAFFYAGMVSRRNTLVMLQQNFIPLGVITLTWVFIGYSLAFGNDRGSGVIADLELFGLHRLDRAPAPALHVVTAGIAIPTLAFVAYQMMFAVITPALATGAVANRLKALGWAVFLAIWSIVVYPPIVHWLWAPAGWLTKRGAQDWAGGMVVHASAGAAALALLVVLGPRKLRADRAPLPHSIPLVIVGAGILWFGWFGFNAGDGLRADGVASQALLNTHVAAAAAMIVWLLIERVKDGHSTVLGAVTGAVAGLATVTPGAGYVSTTSACLIGATAGLVCHLALKLKTIFAFDDALDVIAVHFVGGVLGSLLVGFFGEKAINPIGSDGLFYGGGFRLLGNQMIALVVVVAFSFVLTCVIAMGVEKTIGLRVAPSDEDHLDEVQQAMAAYHDSDVVGGRVPVAAASHLPLGELPHGMDLSLVTAVLDDAAIHDGQLNAALAAAGAVRVLVSRAHLYSAEPAHAIVRGEERAASASARYRMEIVAPTETVDSIVMTLRQRMQSPVEALVQPIGRTITSPDAPPPSSPPRGRPFGRGGRPRRDPDAPRSSR